MAAAVATALCGCGDYRDGGRGDGYSDGGRGGYRVVVTTYRDGGRGDGYRNGGRGGYCDVATAMAAAVAAAL